VPRASRQVYFTEIEKPGYYDTKIFAREDLKPGNKVQGPLIVEQMDTTILVLPEQTMKVDEYGNLIINTFGEEE
jgi:N-methylhydantoinase A